MAHNFYKQRMTHSNKNYFSITQFRQRHYLDISFCYAAWVISEDTASFIIRTESTAVRFESFSE
jgi:hypothetical protein